MPDESNQQKADQLNAEGLKLVESGNLKAAAQKFNQALKIDPTYAEAYHNIGDCFRFAGNPAQAIKFYNQALKIDPSLPAPYYNRATLHQRQKQFDLALADYERFRQLGGPKDPGLAQKIERTINRLKMVVALTKELAEQPPPPSGPMQAEVHELFERGQHLHHQNDPQGALANLNEAIRRDPGQADIYYWRGLVYQANEQPDQAALDFNRALQINPWHVESLIHRASILQKLGDFESALADYNQVIPYRPQDAHLHLQRGIVNRKLDNPRRAMADFNTAINLNPDLAEAYYQRSILYQKIDNFRASLADLDKVLSHNPDHAAAHYRRGIALNANHQYQAAIKAYSRALYLDLDQTDIYLARAMAHAGAGMLEEGIIDMETYLQRGGSPNFPLHQARETLKKMRRLLEQQADS